MDFPVIRYISQIYMETRRREMEVNERLLGIVILMPWRRTEAVILRRRGVCGFVRGILGLF
jgi:hypothetical protein